MLDRRSFSKLLVLGGSGALLTSCGAIRKSPDDIAKARASQANSPTQDIKFEIAGDSPTSPLGINIANIAQTPGQNPASPNGNQSPDVQAAAAVALSFYRDLRTQPAFFKPGRTPESDHAVLMKFKDRYDPSAWAYDEAGYAKEPKLFTAVAAGNGIADTEAGADTKVTRVIDTSKPAKLSCSASAAGIDAAEGGHYILFSIDEKGLYPLVESGDAHVDVAAQIYVVQDSGKWGVYRLSFKSAGPFAFIANLNL